MFQPLFVRPLELDEREVLTRCLESSNKEEAGRAEIILLSSEGKTAPEISQALSFHPSNIKKWIRKFNRDGINGIVVKKRGPQGGPRPHFTSAQTAAIINLANSAPSSLGLPFKEWTPQKLANAAVERGIVNSISHVTVRQILKRNENGNQKYLSALHAAGVNRQSPSHLMLGKEALSKSRYENAAEHFMAALAEESVSVEEEAATRSYLSEALEELSKYEEAFSVLSKYEDPRALASLSLKSRARIRLRIGWVSSWLKNYPKAIASLNEAMKLYKELQESLGVSEASYAIGHTYIRINEFSIARDYLAAAASVQKTTVDRELLARIYNRLGAVDFYEGAFSNAKENNLKALNLAEGTLKTNLIGTILLDLGTTYDDLSDREEQAHYLRRAIEHLEKGGQKDHLARSYNNLGDVLFCAGEWDEAVDSLEKAIDTAQRYAKPTGEATARITLAEIQSARGQFAEAESHLKRSLELLENFEKYIRAGALRILATIYQRTGSPEVAMKTLRESLSLSTSVGDIQGMSLVQIGLAELHFSQRGYDQSREYLEMAQSHLLEEKSLFAAGLVQRLTGQIEAESGRLTEAKQHIAQSLSIFTTIGAPYEVAKSEYEMGLLMQRAGELKDAETNLRHAKATFEKLGAEPILALTNLALSSLEKREEKGPEIVRVSPPSDVLLMQRLIEATSSKELLVQELAAVICENFAVSGIIIQRVGDDARPPWMVTRGIGRAEAESLSSSIDYTAVESITQCGDGYITRVRDGMRSFLAIYMRAGGAVDFARLQPLLKQAELGLETCSLRAAARHATPPLVEHHTHMVMPGFIVGSPLMFDVIERIHKIRTSDVTVLITGESGTGKELVARAIHVESARARAIFLPFNCTATPKEIIDSQLFGHRRGAFTGATTNYPGIIKAADGGTLFLDEIGDLSLEVQPKLMRFLQEGEIQPLGETKPIRVDVRILAATNTDLERAVEDGRFREDLFHRLNIIRIHVPPLRERRDEIPVLASHFLEHFLSRSGKQGVMLTQEAVDALTEFGWPGNVRQLRNEIERVVAYANDGEVLSLEHFSPEIAHPRRQARQERSSFAAASYGGAREYHSNGGSRVSSQNGQRESLDGNAGRPVKLKEATAALERKLIEEALGRNKNNLSRTAIDLGLSRRGLRLKLGQLGIEREERA
ncbi:MAG TPA: sigma 54-interacting transcriptional regulator [Blastocatellia bacterium]|nr:sigma 54-interacting transcriptional regulator [Blastocatellia bacterium]